MATGLEDLGAIPVQSSKINDFSDLGGVAVNQIPIGQLQERMGLLAGTGAPIPDRAKVASMARRRMIQRAELEGTQRFKLVNEGTPQESLQATTLNEDLQAPSHLAVFGQSYKPLIPLVGSGAEFEAGAASGKQLVGDNLLGAALGNLVLGPARAANTVFNPIGGLANEVPVVAQGVGAGLGGGDMESALRALVERAPITSIATIPQANTGIPSLDTLLNTNVNIANAAVDQPLLLAGLTPKALAAQGTAIRNFPRNVKTLATETARIGRQELGRAVEPFRGTTPVYPVAIEAATKKIQDLEFARENNRINKEATAEARNARELIIEEELQIAREEARVLGQQAIEASQQLGPQIELLNQGSAESPNLAASIRARLPAVQEPSQFGTSIAQAIDEANKGAKTQAAEDYSSVKESLPSTQPKLEAPNLHNIASTLSVEESAGLQSLGDKRINSVLSEASKVTKSKVSPEIQNLYDNGTESSRADLAKVYPELVEPARASYTWDDLQKTYQRLNAKISEAVRNQDGNAVRVLSELKDAVSQDMATYAETISPETKALFDEANARFSANRDRLGTSTISKITSDLALETPEVIVSKIVGDKKASVVNNLKQVLSPEKFQEVQAQYADRLFSPSKDVPFDSNHFIKQFEGINNETLRAVFGEEGFIELKRINDLAKGEITAKQLQSTLDDYNAKAQKAQDAYQQAKTSAEKSRILESEKATAEAALDAIKDEKFKRDIEKARADLKAAQTPEKISLIVRALYGLISFAGVATTAGPGTALAAGVAAAAFGKLVHRNIGRPVIDAAISRLNKSK